MSTTWPVHPAAELFPLLADDELRELAEDIRTRGLTQPVWLWKDPERGTVLLDGRNRLRACALAEVEVRTRLFVGDEVEAAEFAISENVRRRHLTTGQKAAVAYESLPILEAANAARANRKRAEAAARRERDEQGRLRAESEIQSRADRPATGPAKNAPPADAQKRARDIAAAKAGTSGRATGRYKRDCARPSRPHHPRPRGRGSAGRRGSPMRSGIATRYRRSTGGSATALTWRIATGPSTATTARRRWRSLKRSVTADRTCATRASA